MNPIDCECLEGLEGECHACERENLEQGIDRAMLQAEWEGEHEALWV